jgi:hypothetical protein
LFWLPVAVLRSSRKSKADGAARPVDILILFYVKTCNYTFMATKKQVAVIGDGLHVSPSSILGAGNGLWAVRRFEKGEWITEYAGVVIDRQQACRMREQGMDSHVRALSCQWECIAGLQNPTEGCGGGSFANDGRNAAANNARFVQW